MDAKPKSRLSGPAWAILISLAAVLLAAGLLGRYGALTPQGRMFVEARASGLKLGRIGRLRIEGVSGDIWSNFSVRRLTIADEGGIWLEADRVAVKWRSGELFARKFHATDIAAQQIRVLRRPTLTPKQKSGARPLAVQLDRIASRLVLEPAFSAARGDYDLTGAYAKQRAGGQSGRADVRSRLHAGDYLKADFDLGDGETLRLNAQAREASAGALAGALGLNPRLPFTLDARAAGTTKDGLFKLDVAVGNDHPAKASGVWNATGGAAAGTLDLAASTLTSRQAARLGRMLRFTAAGTPRQDGFYNLSLSLSSDNLNLAAKGAADIGKRRTGPGGLALTAAMPDLSRVIRNLGSGQVRGVLTGGGAEWSLDGTLAAQRLTVGGYRLAQIEGPAQLRLRNGEWALTGALNGQGGQGTGAIALLGPRPTLKLDSARLRDGRWLLRSVEAAGSGLKLTGQGDRGLLGGLNFKGKLAAASLAALRPGAKGALNADFTAAQGAPGEPWSLNVKAQGADFASGYAEADRLLGPKPALDLRGAWSAGTLTVAEAALTGVSGKATGAGTLAADKLAMKIDWTATGPFRAGPLEIAGAAKGTGAFTGSLAAPALILAADFERIDLPRLPLRNAHLDLIFRKGAAGSDGEAKLTAQSDQGPARAATAFRFANGGLDLTGLDADAGGVRAKGALALRRAALSTADLTVALGPGIFLSSGKIEGVVKIADGAGGATAQVALNGENLLLRDASFTIASLRVAGTGPLSNLPLSVQARGAARPGRWRVDLTGRLTTPNGGGYGLSLQGLGELGRSRISTREAAVLRWNGADRSARLRLAVGAGTADIDLTQQADALGLEALLTGTDLSALNEDLAGAIDARISLKGRGRDLTGAMEAAVTGARERGAAVARSLDGQISATLGGGALKVSASTATPQGLRAAGQWTLPVTASASPLRLAIIRTAPMSGRFEATGEVKPLWDLAVGGERSLSGRADIAATFAGTLAEPQVTGRGNLDGGAFEDGATGLKLENLMLRTVLSQTGVDLQEAQAVDGEGGRVTAAGRLDLRRGAESTLRLDLRSFRVIDNALGNATATGQAILSRAADGRLKLTGALTIDRADLTANTPTPSGVVVLDVIERNRPADLQPDLLKAPVRGPGMSFDLTLAAPRRVFVRGRGLDVEMSLDAHLTGSSNAPLLQGAARVVRGEYDFAGKRFEFDNRGVVYLAARPELIRLDLTAVRDDPTLTARVHIGGTAARPEITLSSSPALPNDEVLSQVLFGASAAQLSPLEAAQLASALAALSGGGGFDVIGNLRAFARLDRLAFAGDAAGGMTVAGGKYLTDDVYLEVIGGGREGPAAQVEWRIRRTLSLVSRLSSDQDSRLSVRWRRDY